jgi:hypothetical protein
MVATSASGHEQSPDNTTVAAGSLQKAVVLSAALATEMGQNQHQYPFEGQTN